LFLTTPTPTPTPFAPTPSRYVPDDWICIPSYYDVNDGCDCACGAWDPDCDKAGQSLYNCDSSLAVCVQPGVCGLPNPTPTSTPVPVPSVVVPSEWTCAASYYDSADGCDCACGAWDPDCEKPNQGLFQCSHICIPPGICVQSYPSPSPSTLPTPTIPSPTQYVPPSWICPVSFYGADDGCDCACGDWDPDCDTSSNVYNCEYQTQICVQPGVCQSFVPTPNPTPTPVPLVWTCEEEHRGTNDGCDCDCGDWDPDCEDTDGNDFVIYGCFSDDACIWPGVCIPTNK
jgi:hypothetical protein